MEAPHAAKKFGEDREVGDLAIGTTYRIYKYLI